MNGPPPWLASHEWLGNPAAVAGTLPGLMFIEMFAHAVGALRINPPATTAAGSARRESQRVTAFLRGWSSGRACVPEFGLHTANYRTLQCKTSRRPEEHHADGSNALLPTHSRAVVEAPSDVTQPIGGCTH